MLRLTPQLSSCCNPPLVYSFNVAPPVRPIGTTSMSQPFRLPGSRKSVYHLLDLFPLFWTVHTDKGQSDLSEAQCDQSAALRRRGVVIELGPGAFNNLDF